ncbi:hypothetical protein like AT4G15953 [Hibiscus trionum]|uniref:Uncharacterized protein n=1 Tax=Hibiscus trionum TaxID=183268 RepID=A0A9W7IZ15_HIBTR|nr:hypothetical protein like AT4G15953 [Hibiscus trionum]
MAFRLAFLFLVFTSLLAFHECSRSSRIELDRNVTAGSKITLSPCAHNFFDPTKWCCISLKSNPCFPSQQECLANCPPGGLPPATP